MKTVLFFISFILFGFSIEAQTKDSVKGAMEIIKEKEKNRPPQTVPAKKIQLLNPKDSIQESTLPAGTKKKKSCFFKRRSGSRHF
ncbi:MAG: hypothetical protein QM640_01565 [Niabella sp.]